MQLEPEAPGHRSFPRTVAQQNLLYKNSQWKQHLFFQFHKTVIRHTLGKHAIQMLADIFLVIMLEAETS